MNINDTMQVEGSQDGRTALHLAASRGDFAATTQLLGEIKDGFPDINQLDMHGWTALHCACNNGHLEVCDALLQNGADPSIPTNDGNLALHYVASRPPVDHTQTGLYADAEDDRIRGENVDNGVRSLPTPDRNPFR